MPKSKHRKGHKAKVKRANEAKVAGIKLAKKQIDNHYKLRDENNKRILAERRKVALDAFTGNSGQLMSNQLVDPDPFT